MAVDVVPVEIESTCPVCGMAVEVTETVAGPLVTDRPSGAIRQTREIRYFSRPCGDELEQDQYWRLVASAAEATKA